MAQGAFVYFLGFPAKFAGFLVMWVAANYYGTQELGIYIGAWALIQVALKFTCGGVTETLALKVAQLIPKASRNNPDRPPEVYHVISNALYSGILISLLWVIGYYLSFEYFFANQVSEEIQQGLHLFLILIPLHLISQLSIACTRGILKVKYDMITNSIIKQSLFLLIVLMGIAFQELDYRLIYIQIIVHAIACIASIFHFSQWFSLPQSFTWTGLDFNFLKTAFPLTLNDVLSHFTQELDIVMLTLYATVNEVQLSFYGVAISIVFGIRMLRRNFLKVFIPLASNYIQYDQWDELNANYNSTQRWITYLALPLFCLIVLFPQEILAFYHKDYSQWSYVLMILGFGSLINSLLGIYGAFIFSAGKSMLVLINTSLIVGLNAILNYYLIPRYGLLGAACATAISMSISHLILLIECQVMFPKIKTDLLGLLRVGLVFITPSAILFLPHLDPLNSLVKLGIWIVGVIGVQLLIKPHIEDQAIFMKVKSKLSALS